MGPLFLTRLVPWLRERPEVAQKLIGYYQQAGGKYNEYQDLIKKAQKSGELPKEPKDPGVLLEGIEANTRGILVSMVGPEGLQNLAKIDQHFADMMKELGTPEMIDKMAEMGAGMTGAIKKMLGGEENILEAMKDAFVWSLGQFFTPSKGSTVAMKKAEAEFSERFPDLAPANVALRKVQSERYHAMYMVK